MFVKFRKIVIYFDSSSMPAKLSTLTTTENEFDNA